MPGTAFAIAAMLLIGSEGSLNASSSRSTAPTTSANAIPIDSADLADPPDLQAARLIQGIVVEPHDVDILGLGEVLWVSADGSRALVVAIDERLNVCNALFSIWPECAAVACGLLGTLLVGRARRLRRIPFGAPHCARCGYLLYGEPDRCSECGTVITPDAVAYGRSATPVLIAGVVLLLGGLSGYLVGRSRLPRESDWVHEHARWYSRALYRQAERFDLGWVMAHGVFTDAVVEYDVGASALGRDLLVARCDIERWDCIAPPSDIITIVADEAQMIVISALETTSPRVASPGDGRRWPCPIGWSQDAERLFFYDIQQDAVGAANMRGGGVHWLFEIPSHLSGCFGPWGPFFDLHPSRNILLIDDPPAGDRSEPMARLRDLDRNEWLTTLDSDDGYGRLQFTSDGLAVIGIDWNPHGSGFWGETDESVFTYWPLDDVSSAHHAVFLDDFEYDEWLAFDSGGPGSWRLVGATEQKEGGYLIIARDYRVSLEGEVETSDVSYVLPWPANLETDDWWSNSLTMRDRSRVEWRLSRFDSLGSALFVYDLGLPPIPR